jgi:hypothetical protein
LAARDFSRAQETFIDRNDQVNEILYSILTPLGYKAYVSRQRLRHIKEHLIALKYENDIAYILNNPDLVTPNFESRDTHIFYKAFYGKLLLAVPVHLKNELRYVASMYDTEYIKGLKQNRVVPSEFLYLRGGFKWKKWR